MQPELLQSLFYGAALTAGVALTARLLGILCTRIGIPDLLGALAAGVLLGPQLLRMVVPASGTLSSEILSKAATLGLILLMTIAGLSLQTNVRPGERGDISAWVAATIVAFLLALATASAFPVPAGWEDQGKSGAYLLVLALAVAVTSVPFLTKVFLGLNLLQTSLARRVLQAACVIDILVWALYPLTAINASEASGYVVEAAMSLIAVIAFLVGARLSTILLAYLRRNRADDKLAVDLVLLTALGLICAFLAGKLHVHAMVASFFFGYMARELCDPQRLMAKGLGIISEGLFIPVYFATIGASIASLASIDPLLIAFFLAWSFGIKGVCIYLASRLRGVGHPMATVLSVVLNTRGGPGIALAAVAFTDAIIDERTFVAFVVAAVATTVASHILLKRNKALILERETGFAESWVTTHSGVDRMRLWRQESGGSEEVLLWRGLK